LLPPAILTSSLPFAFHPTAQPVPLPDQCLVRDIDNSLFVERAVEIQEVDTFLRKGFYRRFEIFPVASGPVRDLFERLWTTNGLVTSFTVWLVSNSAEKHFSDGFVVCPERCQDLIRVIRESLTQAANLLEIVPCDLR